LVQKLKYILEACAAGFVYFIFKILDVDKASALGGWLGRTVGPYLGVSKIARNNIKNTFPNLSEKNLQKVILEMWDNLGRTAAEHCHLDKFKPYIKDSRVEVFGIQYLEKIRKDGAPALFFSAHLANWEVTSLGASELGINVHLVYRRANNPFFDKLVMKTRDNVNKKLFPKGPEGARAIIKKIKNGESVAMLVDQKMNDGIAVPFFGRDAMTAPAIAELSMRYKCPIIPVRVERTTGAYFKITVYPPLNNSIQTDKNIDSKVIMTEINEMLESWIEEKPAQWLWIHKRWPNS
jgi:KDO2-lipid IV(A) lauroyltransferase